ncbi:MAG: hypothetical protein C0483_19910 [Pirellula sp.]|nr:hypothetical protein [Pirellula sp.]
MSKLPERLVCRATLYGADAAGILLMATFEVVRKNSYSFLFGPTGADGTASLDGSTIPAEAEAQLSMAIMDYSPIAAAYTGKITVKAMSKAEILKAIDAFNLFQKHTAYLSGYQDLLNAGLRVPLLDNSALIKVEIIQLIA